MVWVNVLDDAVEEQFWHTLDFDEAKSVLGALLIDFAMDFLEAIWCAEHCSEVLAPLFEDLRVSFDENLAVNFEYNIVEFVKVHADFHILQCLTLFPIFVILRRLNISDRISRVILKHFEIWIWIKIGFQAIDIKFHNLLQFWKFHLNLPLDQHLQIDLLRRQMSFLTLLLE